MSIQPVFRALRLPKPVKVEAGLAEVEHVAVIALLTLAVYASFPPLPGAHFSKRPGMPGASFHRNGIRDLRPPGRIARRERNSA